MRLRMEDVIGVINRIADHGVFGVDEVDRRAVEVCAVGFIDSNRDWGTGDGNAFGGEEVLVSAKLDRSVFHQEVCAVDGFVGRDIGFKCQAKNGSRLRIDGELTMIGRESLVDIPELFGGVSFAGKTAILDVVVGLILGNAVAKNGEGARSALLPMSPTRCGAGDVVNDDLK